MGGIAEHGMRSELTGNGIDDVLSGSEIVRDAVSGLIGGAVGHIAGSVIHVPDDPVLDISPSAVGSRTSWAQVQSATYLQWAVGAVPTEGATEASGWATNWAGVAMFSGSPFDWLVPPPPPPGPCFSTSTTQGGVTTSSGCQ